MADRLPDGLEVVENEGRAVFRSGFQGRLYEVKIGFRNLAKGAMRHFWKIANRAIVAFAGKIFCENPGKSFWRKCFGLTLPV